MSGRFCPSSYGEKPSGPFICVGTVSRWVAVEEFELIEKQFRSRAGVPGVIGAIDGCQINITAPEETKKKRVFVEHACVLLKNRWRRLGFIETDVRKCVQIFAACCCLHNFIISNEAPILTKYFINFRQF